MAVADGGSDATACIAGARGAAVTGGGDGGEGAARAAELSGLGNGADLGRAVGSPVQPVRVMPAIAINNADRFTHGP